MNHVAHSQQLTAGTIDSNGEYAVFYFLEKVFYGRRL